jgi:hypothetical protein
VAITPGEFLSVVIHTTVDFNLSIAMLNFATSYPLVVRALRRRALKPGGWKERQLFLEHTGFLPARRRPTVPTPEPSPQTTETGSVPFVLAGTPAEGTAATRGTALAAFSVQYPETPPRDAEIEGVPFRETQTDERVSTHEASQEQTGATSGSNGSAQNDDGTCDAPAIALQPPPAQPTGRRYCRPPRNATSDSITSQPAPPVLVEVRPQPFVGGDRSNGYRPYTSCVSYPLPPGQTRLGQALARMRPIGRAERLAAERNRRR